MARIETLSDLDGTPHANVFPDSELRTVRFRLDGGDVVRFDGERGSHRPRRERARRSSC